MADDHPLLRALRVDFPDLHASAFAHDWIVLLPPAESLAAAAAAPLSEQFVASHIVRNAVSDLVHATLNGRHIIIDGTSVLTDRGFPDEVACEILADSLQVSPAGRSFTVYTIDKPLVRPELAEAPPPADAAVLSQLVLAVDGGQRALDRMMERITLFSDVAAIMDTVAAVQEDIQKLLNDCFKLLSTLSEAALRPLLAQRSISWDALFQLVESFVMEHTYEIVFFRITSALRAEDALVADIATRCQHLDLCQMGLPPEFGPNLHDAALAFQRLAIARTPHEKIKALSHSIQILSRAPSHPAAGPGSPTLVLTSDFLVPLLILLIIRSNTLNMHSNFFYIKSFSFEFDVESGEYGYILSSLEGVLHYIQASHAHLADLSADAARFFAAVEAADIPALARIFDARSPSLDLLANPVAGSAGSIAASRSVVNCCNWAGETALIIAARRQHAKVVRFLLDRAQDPNRADYEGSTPLHAAASVGSVEIAQMLIDAGASSLATNKLGRTPLAVALAAGNDHMIALLASPASVLAISTTEGCSPIHLATTHGAITQLLTLGADPNARTNDGLTPVLYHCHAGQTDAARALIENGLAPDGRVDLACHDIGHRSILHVCAFRGSLPLVQLMLSPSPAQTPQDVALSISVSPLASPRTGPSPKFDINAATLRGNTPLHAASDANEFEIVEALLKAGADPLVRNLQGRPPADLAHNDDVRNLIEDYALFATPSPDGRISIARVVRARLTDKEIMFYIKSGKYRDFSTISTVVRTLSDFGMLRSQLMAEHSEAAIPDMRELFANPSWVFDNVKTTGNLRLLRKIVRRLDKFLDYLLRHPIFNTHELTAEFLEASELEADMIRARSESKIEYLRENIRLLHYPYVEDLAKTTARVEDRDSKLLVLHAAVRQTGLSSRNIGKARKALAFQLRSVRHHLSRPSSTLFENKAHVSEVFCKSAELLMKQATSDMQEMGDFFLECVYEISGARQALLYYHQMAEDYVLAAQQADSLTTALEKLQAQASRTNSEDVVRKLSEAYYEQSTVAARVEDKACFLNYTSKRIVEEMDRFQAYHEALVDEQIQAHVKRQLEFESSLKLALQSALNQF